MCFNGRLIWGLHGCKGLGWGIHSAHLYNGYLKPMYDGG